MFRRGIEMISEYIVWLREVDDGLRSVAEHEDHHHPGEEGGHGPVPPLEGGDVVVPPRGPPHGTDDAAVQEGDD